MNKLAKNGYKLLSELINTKVLENKKVYQLFIWKGNDIAGYWKKDQQYTEDKLLTVMDALHSNGMMFYASLICISA